MGATHSRCHATYPRGSGLSLEDYLKSCQRLLLLHSMTQVVAGTPGGHRGLGLVGSEAGNGDGAGGDDVDAALQKAMFAMGGHGTAKVRSVPKLGNVLRRQDCRTGSMVWGRMVGWGSAMTVGWGSAMTVAAQEFLPCVPGPDF